MIAKFKKLLLCAGIVLVVSSCITDERSISPDAESNTVRFTLAVPGMSHPIPVSRALTETQENTIESVDVLAFYNSGADDEKLAYHKVGTLVSGTTFEVELPEGDYDLMVVGNAADVVKGAGLAPRATTKTAAIAALTLTKTGKWDYTKPIPVWGYKDGVTVDENTSLTGDDAIDMHRMLVRIDVQLSTLAASGVDGGTGNANFELKEVYLANYNTVGQVAPNYTTTGVWNPTGGVVNAGKGIALLPSVPTAPGKQSGMAASAPWAPAQLYGTADGVAPSAATRTIYTFEADNGDENSHDTNPCIVIGGSYKGEATTYYRLDFVTKSGSNYTYLDLLRNHRYTIAISKVSGTGYDTPKEAFDARSSNIEMNTLLWEDGGMDENIVFNGQYYLKASPGSFALNASAYDDTSDDNRLTIDTDYEQGWTAAIWDEIDETTEKPVGQTQTWLSIDPASGDGTDDEVVLTLEANDDDAPRTAWIVITAGTLSKAVKVSQGNEDAVYTVTVVATAGGTVTQSHTEASAGETISVGATPEAINTFDGWTIEGSNFGLKLTANPLTFTMPAHDVTLTANFTVVPLWGGDSEVLYWDGTTIRAGRFIEEDGFTPGPVTLDNMVFTRFGSIVGFLNGNPWTAENADANIVFNPTLTTNATFGDGRYNYETIPNYISSDGLGSAWTSVDTAPSVSDPAYHNATNLAAGKGDICKLIGFDLSSLAGKTAEERGALLAAYTGNDGWRLPTARENVSFVGGDPANTTWTEWKTGDESFGWPNQALYPDEDDSWPYYYNFSNQTAADYGSLAAPDSGRFPVVTDAYNDAYTQILPTAGYRTERGAASTRGMLGRYWSSTAASVSQGHMMYIDSNGVHPVFFGNYNLGSSVRCVKE